tara:strand:+ start:7138 stop:8082 length:945 start_codon:yes stop_codon:yes gene_type:complete
MTYLNLSPKNHKKIYVFEEVLLNLNNLYKNNNLPNKILFSGASGIGKSTLAYHLINLIFSKNEDFKYDLTNLEIKEFNKSYSLINTNSHPNFFLLEKKTDNKNIEISQVRDMINFTNKSSFNNEERIILIDGIENLNKNSLNALLKVIEEPNENVFFILIFDNTKFISDTLRSRCIKFNLNMSFEKSVETTNKIINSNVSDIISSDLIHYYNTPGDFINLLNFANDKNINLLELNLKDFVKFMIQDSDYKKNSFIQKNIFKFIELYFNNLIKINTSNKLHYLYFEFIKKISDVKKYNLDFESLIIEFKTKVLNE